MSLLEVDALDAVALVGWGLGGLVAGAVVSILLTLIMRMIVRRTRRYRFVPKRLRLPQRIFFMLLGTGTAFLFATRATAFSPAPEWRPIAVHVFIIAMILSGAYLLTGVIRSVEDSVIAHRTTDAQETHNFRRVRTQVQVITRVAIVVVWLCAVAGVLLTFEEFRAIGASLMASAGVLSIVAGLAAQSSLANVFAGVQIAFSDAIRVDDLVVFNSQMGNVEEITLTYVVVRTWDDRRWIVPSTEFTTKSFENWTRREPKLLGSVEFDLDWLVPVEAMRVELMRLVRSTELWDQRSASMQVTDATGGHVRVRAVVSAASSGDLWDLRCFIREELIAWVQRQAVYALPRTRLEPETTTAPPFEEREDFIERTVSQWEDEQSRVDTKVLPIVELSPDDPTEESVLPAWMRSLLIHRKEARGVPRPEQESPTETTLSSRSPEARLYSGSPEAEERGRKLSGPSDADMAERQQAAERRRASADAPVDPDATEPDEGRDEPSPADGELRRPDPSASTPLWVQPE